MLYQTVNVPSCLLLTFGWLSCE